MGQIQMFDTENLLNKDGVGITEEGIDIQSIYGDIPVDVADNSYLNIFRKNEKNIHNIALYPCKFIPELPSWAIKKYSKEGDVVLDAFCGGGTTLIEALKLNRNVYGFDYNPYAVLLSKVKSRFVDVDELNKHLSELITRFLQERREIALPTFKGVDFWFNQEVLRGLSVIKMHVNEIDSEEVRDFFRIVFSMAVRKTSYIATGQILTARRNDWKECEQYSERDTYEIFKSFAVDYISHLRAYTYECTKSNSFARVEQGDATNISLPEEADLIVASPPYINAMDYIWANRLRIHWLDLVRDDKDRLDLYENEMGTERIKAKEYKEVGRTGYGNIDETIQEIYDAYGSNQQSRLRSRVVYRYFVDMEAHLKSAYEKLKGGGRYCIVIGDNSIRKVKVRTTDFLIEIAERMGFEKELQFNILLKNRSLNVDRKLDFADIIKYDRMIVLRK